MEAIHLLYVYLYVTYVGGFSGSEHEWFMYSICTNALKVSRASVISFKKLFAVTVFVGFMS